MHTPFTGELLGTLMLILLGDGVVAGVLLNHSKAQIRAGIVITAGWAFASWPASSPPPPRQPRCAPQSGRHAGFAIVSGDYSKLAVYIPAQPHRRLPRRGSGSGFSICPTGPRRPIRA